MANIFNIGLSGLASAQRQLSTVGHNIANVNTEGYSRQRVNLVQLPAQTAGGLFLGSGVEASSIVRIADQFLVGQLRSANANEAGATAYLSYASQVDNLIGNGTFTASLEQFFSALQDANGSPASISARAVLLNSAESFAARFSDIEQRLSATARDINGEIEAAVSDINSLASSIARMNENITQAYGRSQGDPPNDLLDRRDQLIIELSKLVGVNTIEQEDGALNVFIGTGQLIVANNANIPLVTVRNPLDGTRIEVAVGTVAAPSIVSQLISNGRLGAVLNFRDDLLEPTRNAIGRLAAAFAISFNEQHREGFNLNDQLGVDVFSISAPQVNASTANTGTVTVALNITDVAALTTADYRLSYDGANFILINLSNSTSQTLVGAGPFNVDGMTITIGVAPVAGDVYQIQPTKFLARNMAVTISNPNEIALARPNRTGVDIANIGNATISSPTVLDVTDANLLVTTQLVFNDPPTTFQVGGVGPLIPYTSGSDIDLNGWRVQIVGLPQSGDVFTIEANVGGAGDNGNGLALGELQLDKILDGATTRYQDAYSQLVGTVGSKTQQTQLSRDALVVLLENAQASRDSLSAVNLDEEAANLLRFQQAYAAAAQVIATANSVFDALLLAVRR